MHARGIFMALSVENTSEVWDVIVDTKTPGTVDKHGGCELDKHGGCEHLRGIIGKGAGPCSHGHLKWNPRTY